MSDEIDRELARIAKGGMGTLEEGSDLSGAVEAIREALRAADRSRPDRPFRLLPDGTIAKVLQRPHPRRRPPISREQATARARRGKAERRRRFLDHVATRTMAGWKAWQIAAEWNGQPVGRDGPEVRSVRRARTELRKAGRLPPRGA